MESVLESQSFNYSMEDIRFGDENQKVEKAKQSFLQLKQKICRTNDVIQQYSHKVKECERLKIEVENSKKETDEWKTQHFTSLAKILKLNTIQSELEKSKKILSQEVSELEIKIASDQKHLQQLMCKLEDIEDRHSEKLMTIELQKSGLQTKITDLEQQIKLLHKTYDIKKVDTKVKNAEKSKKGRRIKSPMKTARNTGLLPEINDEISYNVEATNVQVPTPPHPINSGAIETNGIVKDTISTGIDLPNLIRVDVSNDDKLQTTSKNTLFEPIHIEKPMTCDQNIMTDEFYSTKNNVYPLLCDKCEVILEPMPVDKIFKVMTALPPLISTVPPSPIPSRPINPEIEPINISKETNTSVQNDSNVSLVLDKVQQSLETLEKQMKKNDKKRRNAQNIVPHCSHTFPTNCCNHSDDFIDNKNFSQMNMMTTLWSSMMNFANERLPKRPIKRKKKPNIKSRRRKEIKKNLRVNSDSWIVESDMSSVTESHPTIDSTAKTLDIAPVEGSSTKKLIDSSEKERFNSLEEECEKNIKMTPVQFASHHHENKSNCVDNAEIFNSFEKASTSTPRSDSTNSIVDTPNILTTKTAQNPPDDSTHLSIDVDPTVRKQMRPANVTKSAPKSRTGLLQKLRLLTKNNKPVNLSGSVTKVNSLQQTNESMNSSVECVLETKKRIAHVNRKVSEEPEEILNTKRRKVACSMTKSNEPSNLTSPKPTSDQIIDFSKQRIKSKNVSASIINTLFGSDDCDEDDSNKMDNNIDDLIVNDEVGEVVTNSTTDIAQTSEYAQENKEVLIAPNIQSSVKINKSNNTLNSDNDIQNMKSPSIIADEEKRTEVVQITVEKVTNNEKVSAKLLEKNNLMCGPDKIQVNGLNEITENLSKSLDRDLSDRDCGTNAQLMNSPLNLLTKSTKNGTDFILATAQPIGVRNPRSLLKESVYPTSSVDEGTLRKRRRTDNITKCHLASPLKVLLEKKKQIPPMLNKCNDGKVTSPARTSKKSLVPEFIQNELGNFFSTKRIMTRSMKKTEESPTAISENSQINQISPKYSESPKTIKKLKTPVKVVDDIPTNSSKNCVKNLFSDHSREKKKLSSNIEADSDQIEDSTISEIKTSNSISNNLNIYNNSTNSEVTVNSSSSSELNDVTTDQESSTSSIDSEMKNEEYTVTNNFDNKSDDNEELKEKNSLQFTTETQNFDNSVKPKIEIQIANDGNTPRDQIIADVNIAESPSICEYDSPLSPDPISITLPDCPASPNSSTSLEFTANAVNHDTSMSEQLSSDEQIQSPNLPEQMEDAPPTNPRISKHLLKYYSGSVRELRNRKVPVIPVKTIPTTTQIESISSVMKEQIDEKPLNIERLLDQHLLMSKQNPGKPKHQKFYTDAAIKATEEIIHKAKQEIMRLTHSPDWDNSIYQSVVEHLSKISSNGSIVKAIVSSISELSLMNEPLDRTHTPPAPMMSRSQQKIISILMSLDKVKPDLILLLLDTINYNLFHISKSSTIEEMQSLARIFIVLSKIKKDRERVRIMICDAMYSLQSKSLLIIHIALTCWPEVLPLYDENRRQYLPMCIVHMINHNKTIQNDVLAKGGQLKSLIKSYYKYPDSNPLSTSVLDELLNELMTPQYDKSVLTAILLLAKKEGTEWTYKNIIKERLLKMIIENKNSLAYDGLVLLGYLLRCFPLSDVDGAVQNIVEQLCAILNAGITSVDIQEGVVMALLLLSTRHNRLPAIARTILSWRPPRPLSSSIQKQLEIFFNSRTYLQWEKFKIKAKEIKDKELNSSQT